MSQGIEPMTAAEYRRTFVANSPLTRRTLAALEDRERLLAERLGPPDHCYWCKQLTFGVDMAAHSRQCDKHPLSADAAVGALVRHLVETTGAQWNPAYIVKVGTGISYPLTREGLQSALDSLLPKEPEVVVGPSGFTYGPNKDWDGALFQWKNGKSWCGPIQSAYDDHIPPADAPVVAALLASSGQGDK